MSLSESTPAKRKPGRPSKSESLAPLWRELTEAAEAYRAATPWMSFANLQYFGVNLETGYALSCILGNGGETFGLVFYHGAGLDLALKNYREAFAGEDAAIGGEHVFESDYLRLEFVRENELPATRRKQLLATGWTPPKRREAHDDSPAWLHFESGVAGSQPQPLAEAHEITMLTHALREAVALMKHHSALAEFDCDDGVWATKEPEVFPFLPRDGEPGDFGWRKLRWVEKERPLPFAEVGAARHLPAAEECWEIARALTLSVKPRKVRGSDRKWFDRMLLIGRHFASNQPPTPLFTDSSAAYGDADEAARRNLLDAVTKAGTRPALLLYEDDALGAALTPLADALGIPIEKSPEPLGVTEALTMMNAGFLPPG